MGLGAAVRTRRDLGSLAGGFVDLDNLTALAPALDALVAVLEDHPEVIVKGAVLLWNVALGELSEAGSQLSDSLCVVLVRVRL